LNAGSAALAAEAVEELGRRFDADAVPERRDKMPPVVGDDDSGAGCTRRFGDVRVVDPPSGGALIRANTSCSRSVTASAGIRRNSGGRRVATEKNSRQQCQAVAVDGT
jgi:hypothetical protein